MYGVIDTSLTLGVKKLDNRAILPTKAHDEDLGYDFYAIEDTELLPGKVTKIKTGIAFEFPVGYGGLIRDRSSVATKSELFVVAGVIDNGYRGECVVALYNPHASTWVREGDKIAQMILIPTISFPLVELTTLSDTSRGERGFGSSDAR